jgi:hypothetical protein
MRSTEPSGIIQVTLLGTDADWEAKLRRAVGVIAGRITARCKRLRIYRKLKTRVDQRINPSATYIGFGLSRRSSSTSYQIL